MTSSREIRSSFLRFFESKGHTAVPSAAVVTQNDPTLMFTNAGMVPFKDVFTGKENRDYTRATSAQKCIRMSGKHNDLENVGRTARHHTFFEMLGNFSFGDYFKRDAIAFAWEFFQDHLKLDPERIVFTVFEGEDGYCEEDTESAKLWQDITGCEPERVIRCNAKENFWQMGATGPCGPCTEIHYYLGDGKPDPRTFGEEPSPDGRGWFELWNLVFMQFNREKENGPLLPLPAPSVDTGMGLERIAVVQQGVLSNYDIDLLSPIVQRAAEISGKTYGGTMQEDDVSMRVIADHARLASILISEGVFPGNSKREYELRRVARRAIRHGYRLGIEEPFFHLCCDKVIDLMGDAYPQLEERRALIADIAQDEEVRFRRTLKGGLDRLRKNTEWNKEGETKELPGDIAFDLYETYGFPLDLTEVIAEEEGFTVDRPGFDEALAKAKQASAGSKLNDATETERVYYALKEEHGETRFLGYDAEESDAKVLGLIVDGAAVDSLGANAEGWAVLDQTPFYGEKGGQTGDRGVLRTGGARIEVLDTQLPVEGLIAHQIRVSEGTLKAGATLNASLDHGWRSAIRRNHSATHLLHWALREVVGATVAQKGSLVSGDRLRFDYSATKPLTAEQLKAVEDKVNEAVLKNTAISTEEQSMDAAKARGAIGIFEEKYGDEVRVLEIGESLELCGGTHAHRTGDIGLFTILSESGLAAGVRRIEAATGLDALSHLREVRGELEKAAATLKSAPNEVNLRIEKALQAQRDLSKEIERLQKEMLSGGDASDPSEAAKDFGGVKVLGAVLPGVDTKVLRERADQLRDKLAPAVILLGAPSRDGKKALLVCSVSKEATKRFRAGDIVKRAAGIVGGGGGGRPDFAQAGGSDPSKLDDAIQDVYAYAEAQG